MPHARRALLVTVPFHVSIVDEMKKISPRSKDGRGRAVQCARLLMATICPKERNLVRQALQDLYQRFKKCSENGDVLNELSQYEVAEFNGAFEALNVQDQADASRTTGTSPTSENYTGMGG
jgi:hypothetical protein